jgi:hypothetical protein
MPPRVMDEAAPAQRAAGLVGIPQSDMPALNFLAVQSLISLFDEEAMLFARRITVTEQGLHRQGTSRRGTIIALLGLQRLAESGATEERFDMASIRDAVWGDATWVRSLADLGLLTWFTALCEPERLGVLLDAFNFGKALESYPDGRQASTTALAWFLTGIGHARLACPGRLPDLTDIAVETYHRLLDNQSENGIFGHAAAPRSFRDAFCRRFGTFADQIYSICALTAFARAFHIEEPLGPTLDCAKSLCALQGEMGQWWFLYDKYACRVVNRYPVFSFHQDGIAPVGLFALEEAIGQSFQESIYKGLSWISGGNELANDLRDSKRGLIWDSIQPRRELAKYWEAALSFMSVKREPQSESLKIRYEARPNHFGWLLYAFGKFGLSAGRTRAAAV